MCGIAGIIALNLHPNAKDKVSQMLNIMKHRGPDFSLAKQYRSASLGHNRLSIIDLDSRSNQPFEKFGLSMVYNGEVYNYIELRKDLENKGYEFQTNSDTEVIITAYKEYGQSCVKSFVGMWSFLIFDEFSQKVFASRDRFGIKPFYFVYQSECLIFASETKALTRSDLCSTKPNKKQILEYLQLGWLHNHTETLYQEIQSLPPAYNLTYDITHDVLEITNYWKPSTADFYQANIEDLSDSYYEKFLESVKLHLRSDVPLGICLSGGLDSSAIATCVSKIFPDKKFKAFHIFYTGEQGVDERNFAQEVVNQYPNIELISHSPQDGEVDDVIQKVLQGLDFPPSGSSPISQYFVMKLAAENGVKVLLDGQGSDEYFSGYAHGYYRFYADLIQNFKLGKLLQELWAQKKLQNFGWSNIISILGKSVLTCLLSESQLYAIEYQNYFPFLGKEKFKLKLHFQSEKGSRLNRFLFHQLFQTNLPTLLHYEDRNSMQFSIESRVPFLDHRLVEFVLNLGNNAKIQNGWTKFLLRKSVEKILPEGIVWRKDKKGFVTPGEVLWLRNSLKSYTTFDYELLSEYLDVEKVIQIMQEYNQGSDKNAKLVWRLAMLNYWLKSK